MRTRDEGTTAIVGFAVVIAIYSIAFIAFMSVVQQPQGQHKEGAALDARADGVLQALLGDTGQANSSANAKADWYTDPDHMTRFGLAEDGQPNVLDLDKMRNLTKGAFAADATNGFLDYDEARASMGLGNYDFHLRTYPVFDALTDAGAYPVKNVHVAYVGNFSKKSAGSNNYPVQYATSLKDMGGFVYLNVTITNNGTTTTIFQTEFSVPLSQDYIVDDANTKELAPGGAANVSLVLYKTDAWVWAGSDHNVSVKINDPSNKVADFKLDLASIDMTKGAHNGYAAITVDASKQFFKTNQKPTLYYTVWDGTGSDVSNVDFTIYVNNSAGTQVATDVDKTGGSGKWEFDAQPAGIYNVTLRLKTNGTFNSTDMFQVTDNNPDSFTSGAGSTLTEGPESVYERSLLANLVEGWKNTTYDVNGGDVYPGTKTVMNNDLANNLTANRYNIVVVGSEVDQTALTSNAAKDAVQQFTFNGGLLIVLGSLNQQVTWLQPLFHATLTTDGNGIGVPDPTHPILHTPEELNYQQYLDNNRTWQFNTDSDAAHFTHVIVRNAGSNKNEDILAVSKPGHFGNGTIVLTAWDVFQLTNPQNGNEATNLLYNFLMQAWGSLYVDMGPRVPDHSEVASSTRMATAPSPVIVGDKVLVRVVLYVFPH